MSNSIFFFTDVDAIATQNPVVANNTDAFGPVYQHESEKFRVTSIHKSTNANYNPRAFAICDGAVCVRFYDDPNDSSLVTIILKPSKSIEQLSGINFSQIKFIVYKGILKDSLFFEVSPSLLAIQNSAPNNLTNSLYEIQNSINRNRENIQDPPLPTGSINDIPSASVLGYDVSLTGDQPVDDIFWNSFPQNFQIPSVKAGWHIGNFSPAYGGIEIVTYDTNSIYRVQDAQVKELIISVSAQNSNSSFDIQFEKLQRESIYSFIDPSAFYGSLCNSKIAYFSQNDLITLDNNTYEVTGSYTIASFNTTYEILLNSFANKNVLYIDIRNEFNNSFNYQGNYTDQIRITTNLDENIINYYSSGWEWPLIKFDTSSFDNTVTENFFFIDISFPYVYEENPFPLAYLVQGFFSKKHPKYYPVNSNDRRRFAHLRKNSENNFTEDIRIIVPRYNGSSGNGSSISSYVRIKYCKRAENNPTQSNVFRSSHVLDNIFKPKHHKISFSSANSGETKIQVYDEHFIGIGSDDKASNYVGIFEDDNLISYTVFPRANRGNSIQSTSNFITQRTKVSSLFSFILNKFPKIRIFGGPIFDNTPNSPSYIYFEKKNTFTNEIFERANSLNSNDFYALILDKSTVLSFPASTHFDSVLSLSNKQFFPATSQNRPYTSFDLNLISYDNDGFGNLTINNLLSSPIKVYGFDENPNILVQEGVPTPSNILLEDDFHHCLTFPTMSASDRGDIFSFVESLKNIRNDIARPSVDKIQINDILDNVFEDNSTSIKYLSSFHISGLASSPIIRFPYRLNLIPSTIIGTFSVGDQFICQSTGVTGIVLSYNTIISELILDINLETGVLNNGDQISNSASTSSATIGNITITPPSNGFLSETSFVYAMWKLRRDLRNDIDNNPPTKSAIFQALKASLISKGFIDSLTDIEAANIIDPDIPIGTSTFHQVPLQSRKSRLYCAMSVGNHDVFGSLNCTAAPTRLVYNYADSRKPKDKRDIIIFESMNDILIEIKEVTQRELKKTSDCLFNTLTKSLKLSLYSPQSLLVATGDGSATIGILATNNSGLIFFFYNWDPDISGMSSFLKIKTECELIDKFKARQKNKQTTIHLSMLGMDLSYKPSKALITITNKISSKIYSMLFEANYDNPILKPSSNEDQVGGVTVNEVGSTSRYEFKIGEDIFAIYDKTKKDIELRLSSEEIKINFKLMSDIGVNKSDEVMCMISIVDGKDEIKDIFIKSDKTYKSDEFVLKKDAKCEMLKQPVKNEKVKDGIDRLVNLLSQSDFLASDISFDLHGNFIGIKKKPELITDDSCPYEMDIRYHFNQNPRKSETNDTTDIDVNLQYSFTSIKYNEGKLIIKVESYCSPLISRLACRTTVQAYQEAMKQHTLAGCDSTNPNHDSTATVTTTQLCPPSPSDTIPSYNPVLSALRCFGILDAIRSLIIKRAQVLGKSQSDINSILLKFDSALSTAKVEANKSLGLAKDITINEFNSFKWNNYPSQIYGDIDPSSNCD
jgi:hypothetical protein